MKKFKEPPEQAIEKSLECPGVISGQYCGCKQDFSEGHEIEVVSAFRL